MSTYTPRHAVASRLTSGVLNTAARVLLKLGRFIDQALIDYAEDALHRGRT